MNRKETLALYEKGKDAWNKWANNMLAEKDKLKEEGKWRIAAIATAKIASNKASEDWFKRAKADFSSDHHPETFDKKFDCYKFIFPGDVLFKKATFELIVGFVDAQFKGNAWFSQAQFKGDAKFFDSIFSGTAIFRKVNFNKEANFRGAVFSHIVDFKKTIFQQNADFQAIHSHRSFSLAGTTFHKVPNFLDHRFGHLPRVDDMKVLEHGQAGNKEMESKFRALKAMAVQAHDHQKELDFFAEKLKCKGAGYNGRLGNCLIMGGRYCCR